MNKKATPSALKRIIADLFDRIEANEKAVASVQRAQDTEHTILGPGKSIKLLGEDEQVAVEISGSNGGAIKYVDGPDPAQPEAPDVETQEGQLIVAVDGFDVQGEPAPADLEYTIVHYSREENFAAYQGTAKAVIKGGAGQQTLGVSAGIWHVRVQWQTRAGKLSEPSDAVTVDVSPPVNAEEIEADLQATNQRITDNRNHADGKFSDYDTGMQEQAENLAAAQADIEDAHDRIDTHEMAIEGENGLKQRLGAAEQTLQDKADASLLPDLEERLQAAFGEDLEGVQEDVEEAAKTAYLDRLVVREGFTTPEALILKLWVDMAVVSKLQAESAWIEKDMVVNGTITAEKIEASREMTTKIFGTEWAYVAEQLVVEGELIVNNATVINAALQRLSVTERADFAEAFFDEIFSAEATALIATIGRAIVSAPNLIPGMANIREETPPPFRASGFGRNTGDPSIWVQGRTNARTSDASDAVIHLVEGEEYAFNVESKASVDGTRFYVQLLDMSGSSATGTRVDGSNTSYLLSNVTANTDWDNHQASFTVPATANYRLLFYANHSNGVENDGYQWFMGLAIRAKLDGSLTVDNTIDARHLNVTETMVGRFAEFLHLVVDRIDVNALWADTSWQREAYFGHQDADSSTYIDGTGMIVHRRDEDSGGYVPALQFGGGAFGINWYDETTGEPIGGISNEGDVRARSVQASSYDLEGRPVFSDPESYPGEGAIFDILPRGEQSHGYANMNGQSRSDRRHWGFLELEPFEVEPGRTYNISLQPFRMGDTKNYFMSFNYTTDRSSPNWNSTQAALFTQAGNTFSGSFRFIPETAGLVRMIVYVYAGSNGITFSTSGSEVLLTVFDEGLATRGVGFTRNATDTNPDHQPLVREYHTGWPITWHQNYANGQPGYDSFRILQGVIGNNTITSMFGYQSSVGLVGGSAAEIGRTMPQALTGATLHSGSVALRGVATPAGRSAHISLHWHTNKTAPSSMQVSPYPGNFIGTQLVRHAEEVRWQLPEDCLDAIRANTFGGFALHPRGSSKPYFAIGSGTGASSPILRLQYTR